MNPLILDSRYLSWIHMVEARIGRRLSDEELDELNNIAIVNHWVEQADIQRKLQNVTEEYIQILIGE